MNGFQLMETMQQLITDYAQGELGDIVYVEIESIGDTLRKKKFLGLLRQ